MGDGEQVGDQCRDLLYFCRARIFDLLSSCFNLLVRNAVIIKPSSLLNYISLDPHISPNFTAPGSGLLIRSRPVAPRP